ncbi:MAG: hypothetical protein MRZ29_05640, partial [Oscillospiraceae bacterium]|nr:hypothetical protein [Oscillospiraceae bacterium]
MKKLVCMLMALCMLLSAVNVLAFEQVTENGSPKYTSSANYTNSGDINDTNTEYEFKSPSGYYYTVIPVDTVTVDGEKQYLFISNNYYGKFPDGTVALTGSATKEEREKFIFDPEITTSYAYWLNNGFFDGSKKAVAVNSNGGVALDSEIASYIRTHDWYVNGYNGKSTDNTYIDKKYNFDYTVNCKVAVLSIDDIVKYAQYMKKTLKSAGSENTVNTDTYACILRTFGALDGAGASSLIKRQNPASGNAANSGSSLCGIRPIFYVSEDYFKNVKLDLTTAGSEVKKIISELNPSIYSSEELLSLKGIYTLTEDGSEALSTDEWTTNTAGATAENGVINLPGASGKWLGRSLPQDVKGGIINIEAEVIGDVAKNSLHIGLLYNNGTGPSFKYPLYLYDNGILGYYTEAKEQTGAKYQRLDNNSNDLWYTHFASPRKLRLIVNLDTGNCYVSVSGEKAGPNTTANIRYSTGTTVVPYVDSTQTFSKIVFYNSSANSTTLDNIKITYDPNGNAIKSVEKTGDKEIEITVEDYVDLQSVTKDSICLTANTATAISVNGNKITATLANKLTNGDKCVIVNDMKRNDVGDANYTIIGNSALFTVTAPTETVIGTPVISGDLTSGTKVSATSAVTKGTSTAVKPVQFVIAAYNGDRLIGAKIESIENVNNVNELKAELTLSEN